MITFWRSWKIKKIRRCRAIRSWHFPKLSIFTGWSNFNGHRQRNGNLFWLKSMQSHPSNWITVWTIIFITTPAHVCQPSNRSWVVYDSKRNCEEGRSSLQYSSASLLVALATDETKLPLAPPSPRGYLYSEGRSSSVPACQGPAAPRGSVFLQNAYKITQT